MAANSRAILRRALLYVPASDPRMLSKSRGFTVDNVTYDLEDSVTPAKKPQARTALREHLIGLESRPSTIRELAVRINALSTGLALDDLGALANLPQVDAIVVPKVNSANDLTTVTDALRQLAPERHSSSPSPRGPIKLLALIESARAIMDLPAICGASPYLSGLIFAAEDFALDMSITRTPSLSEFLYARSAMVTAARAARIPSIIDLVCTSYKGEEGIAVLEEECRGGKTMGFNGKQCIHPSQISPVQRIFAPSPEEMDWAVRIVIADEKAAKAGRGAWSLDGRMIDAPVVGRARALVAKAEDCGIDVEVLKRKWASQAPE